MTNIKKIAVTLGDPSGIGAEVVIKALNSLNIFAKKFIIIGNKEIFYNTAKALGVFLPQDLEIIDIPCDISKINIGEAGIEGGRCSFLSLKLACDLANEGKISSIATAPLSKEAINMAGYHYSGQTEILEDFLGKRHVPNLKAEMLFVAKNFRVMLLTRHIPLSNVSQSLNIEGIIASIKILDKSLKENFKIKSPKIAVCGLNPHSGENGLLGEEEKNIIIPAIKELRQKFGINVEGAFPADTIWIKAVSPFLNNLPQPYDGYAACSS